MKKSTSNKVHIIDDRPINMLSKSERIERFERHFGDSIEKLSPEQLEMVRTAYLIRETDK